MFNGPSLMILCRADYSSARSGRRPAVCLAPAIHGASTVACRDRPRSDGAGWDFGTSVELRDKGAEDHAQFSPPADRAAFPALISPPAFSKPRWRRSPHEAPKAPLWTWILNLLFHRKHGECDSFDEGSEHEKGRSIKAAFLLHRFKNFDPRLNQPEGCVTATPIGHEPDPDKANDHHSPGGRLGHRPDIAGYIHSNLFDGA
jgi:hypothetical protein